MAIITNFNVPGDLSELKQSYDDYRGTNIDAIFEAFEEKTTEWSVSNNSDVNDEVFFMCAKSARARLGLLVSHLPESSEQDFNAFIDRQKALYKQYSGYLLGYGIVAKKPVPDGGRWYSVISQVRPFDNPVSFDSFKSFISINSFGSVTKLNNEQLNLLKFLVNLNNPGFFQGVSVPDIEDVDHIFDAEVKNKAKKSLAMLEREAQKKTSLPTRSSVQTKIYLRDPTIAAYVKKRADGVCQLCKKPAPFKDQNDEPYLECHHIEWLSNGGLDSADNCVALCPNCHRKMHILNDPTDIEALKSLV